MLSQEDQIFNQIKKAQNILIIFKQDFNGDSIASSLALLLILKKLNKKAKIVTDQFDRDDVFKKFNFLPESKKISNNIRASDKFIISLNVQNTKVENIKYELKDNKLNFIINPQHGLFFKKDVGASHDINYDLIIALDTTELNSLAEIYEDNLDFFHTTPIINIDHNSQNENFGQINLIELTKSSVCEILFYLLYKNHANLIDEDIATCLLCGIISKTRNFKTLNVLPNTLASAAKLISLKARREEIINNLYISRDINSMRMLGKILSGLKGELNGKLVWFNLDTQKEILQKENSQQAQLDNKENIFDVKNIIFEAINELIVNVPQIEIIIAFYKMPFEYKKLNDKSSHALIYSTKNINALDLISKFNPSGTRTSAFITLDKPLPETKNLILDEVLNKLKNLI